MERASATPTGSSSITPAEKEYAGVKISLENCLFPQEVFEETPSQKDGLEKTAENDLRRIGCEFIQIAGIMLKVPQVLMSLHLHCFISLLIFFDVKFCLLDLNFSARHLYRV